MKTKAKILLLCLLAVAVIVGAVYFPLNFWLHRFLDWVRSRGALGMTVYGMAYAIGTVLLVPGTLLTAGSGFLYGTVIGTLIVSPASVLGATISFLLARSFARDWVAKKVSKYPKFELIDRAIAKNGFKIVLLMRLDPVFIPFAILNYALGLSRVRLRDYVLASWIGMLPATTLYVYLGSSVKNISDLLQGKLPSARLWPQFLFWGGLVAAAGLVYILTRIARQALQAEMGSEPAAAQREAV
ncbi:MAG: TVP38/TMEM64 family protein [Candidatus Acidiferrales bacterium]